MTEELKFYETPEGVAVKSRDFVTYINVDVSTLDPRLVALRINKRSSDGRRFVVAVDLDEEFATMLAKRLVVVCDEVEKDV